MKKKEPRFFCDNCDAEVGLDLKSCHNCGRLFVSVRCPVCGFSGAEKDFARGCPSCGYSVVPKKKPRQKKKEHYMHPLPMWLYILSVAVLLGVFTLLFTILTR